MKLLTIIFCISATQGAPTKRNILEQAKFNESPYFIQSNLPKNEFNQVNYENTNLPLSSIGVISNGNNYQQSLVHSTPKNSYEFVSSTIAPETYINQQSFSSTSSPVGQEIEGIGSFDLSGSNVDQNRFINFNLNQPIFNDDSAISQFSLESKFGDQNPVTVKAITSAGSIDDAFGNSDGLQLNQELETSKNFYFFAAPEEEPENFRPRINFEKSVKKNVNVVFIKAPSVPKLGPIEVRAPVETQDKTVVYVLVKKPELNQEITVKSSGVSKPQKPDVYFLKYKTEEEAREAVNKVQAGESSINQQIAYGNGASGDQQENFFSARSSFGPGNLYNNVQPEIGFSQQEHSSPLEQIQVNVPSEDKTQVVNIGGNALESFVTPQSISSSSLDSNYIGEEQSYRSSTVSPFVVSSTPFAK